MAIGAHIDEFAGRPIAAFDPTAPAPVDPGAWAWRLDTDYDNGPDAFTEAFAAFVGSPWAHAVRALVIGEWGESYENPAPVAELAAAANRLSSLTALFLGEMVYEECEISWIQHGDVTPLLTAYPALEVLTVRGAEGLTLTPVAHASLRELTFESGGLPAALVRAVGECDLPALTKLELWLGTDNYGGDASADDLAAVLAGTRTPRLRHLGLRDAQIADEVAAAIAGAAVVARLDVLDLSMGMLTDAGGAALLAGQPLTHLSRLDLHHHYLSDTVSDRLVAELTEAGVALDLSDAGDPSGRDRFYVEVSE